MNVTGSAVIIKQYMVRIIMFTILFFVLNADTKADIFIVTSKTIFKIVLSVFMC